MHPIFDRILKASERERNDDHLTDTERTALVEAVEASRLVEADEDYPCGASVAEKFAYIVFELC